ncbi:MAG: flavin monoamine oxidase family protein [Rhodospirillales bacterium]
MPYSDSHDVDVVVVGAGAAGLAAAQTLVDSRRTVAVLEAKDRIGGRAYTATAGLRTAFDHGCYWLHSADENPFTGIADRLGFRYDRGARPRLIHFGDRWADPAEQQEWDAFFDDSFDAIVAVGNDGRDVAVADVLPKHPRWSAPFARFVAAFSGADPPRASTLDFALYRDTDVDWPVIDGYGALVARYGAGVPVRLDTPATRIDGRGKLVRVETPAGALAARAAIVTVSNGVLAAGALRFDPPLPDSVLAAIAGIPMGMANKVAFEFDRDVFGDAAPGTVGFSARGQGLIGFQIRPAGSGLAIGYVGGSAASELEALGPAGMAAHALDELAAIFGSAIRQRVTGAATTAWESDPWIRGGYTAALPGEAHRRADLAAPFDERVFLAGEACSPEFFSTAHGAYLSGVAVARAVAGRLAAAA